jgi:hypothetical protein
MKHSFKWLFLSGLICYSTFAFSQGKTIFIPTIKIPNGENFSVQIDDVSFYVVAKKGKPSSLVAKSTGGTIVPVTFQMTQRIRQSGGLNITEECEACVQVKDPSGEYKVRCYPIDCPAAFQLNRFFQKPTAKTISFPAKAVNGIYSVLRDENLEIKATYQNGIITDYNITSFKKEQVSLEFESIPAGTTSKDGGLKCFIRRKRTLPDGSVITTTEEISCDKLPQPKTVNTN